eukprot:3806741-Rhodomonas_salina.5
MCPTAAHCRRRCQSLSARGGRASKARHSAERGNMWEGATPCRMCAVRFRKAVGLGGVRSTVLGCNVVSAVCIGALFIPDRGGERIVAWYISGAGRVRRGIAPSTPHSFRLSRCRLCCVSSAVCQFTYSRARICDGNGPARTRTRPN